jgi:hypothetical protein
MFYSVSILPHVLVGEPDSASPEHALEQDDLSSIVFLL